MNHKRIIIALAVFMIAVTSVSIIGSEESDAWLIMNDGIKAEGFTTNSNGTLTINFTNTEDRAIKLERVIITEGGNEIYK
ncbi:MAG: hypothetical protein FWC44_02225, partial [Methanomassiliicoccaceae archaeon]|nr:hypothetical protein [Methanomassiliicoccaceae archaeon]